MMKTVKKGILYVSGLMENLLRLHNHPGLFVFLFRALVHRLQAEKALRFLFAVERGIYPLLGLKAVEYGGGIHPKHRHTRYHDFFLSRITPGQRVLDIGCGSGILAYEIAEASQAQVTAIDLDEENIRTARRLYNHHRLQFIHGDVRETIPEGDFDVVVLSNVLEHLGDRVNFLRMIIDQTSAPRLLIRVPCYERDWRVPLMDELGLDSRLDPTHEIEYRQDVFQEELRAANLTVRQAEYKWGEIWCEAVREGTDMS